MADILETTALTSGADVTLVTTAETVIITSTPVRLPTDTVQVLVRAWAQLTSGVGTTAVTARIRRGSAVTGALVGEANSEAIKSAAGSTEPFDLVVSENRAGEDQVVYSLTLQQTGATGNGTVLQAGIVVEVRSP